MAINSDGFYSSASANTKNMINRDKTRLQKIIVQ